MNHGMTCCLLILFFSCTARNTTNENPDPQQKDSLKPVNEKNEKDSPGSLNASEASSEEEPQVIQCTFLGVESSDCPHLTFSCGDFGTAVTDLLPEKEKQLWSSLTLKDENGELIANPEYVGQKFTIVHNYVEGWPCQAGYPDTSVMQRGEVSNILKFSVN